VILISTAYHTKIDTAILSVQIRDKVGLHFSVPNLWLQITHHRVRITAQYIMVQTSFLMRNEAHGFERNRMKPCIKFSIGSYIGHAHL
jgi:hypothetical protein